LWGEAGSELDEKLGPSEGRMHLQAPLQSLQHDALHAVNELHRVCVGGGISEVRAIRWVDLLELGGDEEAGDAQ
jgi:hypothetical protein